MNKQKFLQDVEMLVNNLLHDAEAENEPIEPEKMNASELLELAKKVALDEAGILVTKSMVEWSHATTSEEMIHLLERYLELERVIDNVHTRLSMLGQSSDTKEEAMSLVFEELEGVISND